MRTALLMLLLTACGDNVASPSFPPFPDAGAAPSVDAAPQDAADVDAAFDTSDVDAGCRHRDRDGGDRE